MEHFAYGWSRSVQGSDFDGVVTKVKEALAGAGFGVVMENAMHDILKEKIGVTFRRYVMLGACNPALAHEALQAEAQAGLLLPCNVVVQESDAGDIVVSAADPKAVLGLAANEAVTPIAENAEKRLREVLSAL